MHSSRIWMGLSCNPPGKLTILDQRKAAALVRRSKASAIPSYWQEGNMGQKQDEWIRKDNHTHADVVVHSTVPWSRTPAPQYYHSRALVCGDRYLHPCHSVLLASQTG